ncbi:MAG: M23 family metallopeptidase [Bacteroidaceae bacterium]|nr:M23 family metallopeptidase [Bacteroidaceae bacterium]
MKNHWIKKSWSNLKTRYKLTLHNEKTLEAVTEVRFPKVFMFFSILVILCGFMVVATFIVVGTSLRNYLPGYMNPQLRSEMVHNMERLDSLIQVSERRRLYVMNLQDIIRGTVSPDTVYSIDSLTILRADSLMKRTKEEEIFQQKYEEREKFNLTRIVDSHESDGITFYRPIGGLILSPFDLEKKHFGVDIAAENHASIVSIFDGVVVLSAYTIEYGYTIQVLHSQGFLSVYQHCDSPLKQQGDHVKAGEVIALVTNINQENNKSSLHFELWRNGRVLDPQKYIVF